MPTFTMPTSITDLFSTINGVVSQVVPLATNILTAKSQLASMRNASNAASLANTQASIANQIQQAQLNALTIPPPSQNVVSQSGSTTPYAVTGAPAPVSMFSNPMVMVGLGLAAFFLMRRAV